MVSDNKHTDCLVLLHRKREKRSGKSKMVTKAGKPYDSEIPVVWGIQYRCGLCGVLLVSLLHLGNDEEDSHRDHDKTAGDHVNDREEEVPRPHPAILRYDKRLVDVEFLHIVVYKLL